MIELNGRKVIITGVSNVDPTDYPDFCDAFIVSADWVDTGHALTELELVELETKYPEAVNMAAADAYSSILDYA